MRGIFVDNSLSQPLANLLKVPCASGELEVGAEFLVEDEPDHFCYLNFLKTGDQFIVVGFSSPRDPVSIAYPAHDNRFHIFPADCLRINSAGGNIGIQSFCMGWFVEKVIYPVVQVIGCESIQRLCCGLTPRPNAYLRCTFAILIR